MVVIDIIYDYKLTFVVSTSQGIKFLRKNM